MNRNQLFLFKPSVFHRANIEEKVQVHLAHPCKKTYYNMKTAVIAALHQHCITSTNASIIMTLCRKAGVK